MQNRAGNHLSLPTPLHNLRGAKKMTTAILRQGSKPWTGDIRRRKKDEISYGLYQRHETLQRITW